MSSILTIKDSDFGDEQINVDYNKIQKMAFIYEALENGWTIKKLDNEKYEFLKEGVNRIELKDFLKKNLRTKEILKQN